MNILVYKFILLMILILLICLSLFIVYFHRKPRQNVSTSTDLVHSPAYGEILKIKRENGKIYITIYLSLKDVHYQFSPVAGKITDIVEDSKGEYNLAYELNKSDDNNKVIHTIENDKGKFYVYQISGKYVKKISIHKKKNDEVKLGTTLGIIHFGSRVDLVIENTNNFELLVKEGDYVSGSYSVIGKYK